MINKLFIKISAHTNPTTRLVQLSTFFPLFLPLPSTISHTRLPPSQWTATICLQSGKTTKKCETAGYQERNHKKNHLREGGQSRSTQLIQGQEEKETNNTSAYAYVLRASQSVIWGALRTHT